MSSGRRPRGSETCSTRIASAALVVPVGRTSFCMFPVESLLNCGNAQFRIGPVVVIANCDRQFTKPVFADKRFESVIDDGMKYVARTDRRFDVIIVDSTDPQGPGKVLFRFDRSLTER